jgi:hypothetical protein
MEPRLPFELRLEPCVALLSWLGTRGCRARHLLMPANKSAGYAGLESGRGAAGQSRLQLEVTPQIGTCFRLLHLLHLLGSHPPAGPRKAWNCVPPCRWWVPAYLDPWKQLHVPHLTPVTLCTRISSNFTNPDYIERNARAFAAAGMDQDMPGPTSNWHYLLQEKRNKLTS